MVKNNTLRILLSLILFQACSISSAFGQSTLITSGSNSNLLFPQLTYSQITNIPSPKKGMTVFDNTSNVLRYYNGTEWVSIAQNTSSTASATNVYSFGNNYSSNEANGITTDSQGNSVIVGTYDGNINLNGCTITSGLQASFITKKNKNNGCSWSIKIDNTKIKDVTTDINGNIYVVGSFGDNSSSAFSEFGASITSSGGKDNFIAKFDTDGMFQWVKRSGSFDNDTGLSIAVGNEIYITGKWDGNAIDTYHKLFIEKFDLNGNLFFHRVYPPSSGPLVGKKILIDKNTAKYYIGGTYTSALTIEGVNLPAYSTFNFFILCFDGNDNLSWSKSGKDILNDMAMDNNQNIFVTGLFHTNLSLENITITSEGPSSLFLLKISKLGSLEWVSQLGKTTSYEGMDVNDIEVDEQNNIYLTGLFYQTLGLGSTILKSNGSYDFFVAKLSTSSQLIWIQKGGGLGFDEGKKVAVSKDGRLYLIGTYSNDIEMNSQILSLNGSTIYNDIFYIQMNR